MSWKTIAPHERAEGDRAVVLDDGRVLVTGKAGSRIYNPARDRWAETGAPMKGDIHSRPLVRTAEGWVLAIGGYVYHSLAVADCELWKANAWFEMPALPAPTKGHACIARHDRVYVFGGYVGTTARSNVHSWSPGEEAWREEAAMPYALVVGRAVLLDDASVVVHGDHVGGERALRWDGTRWHDLGEVPKYCAVTPWRDGFLVVGGSVREADSTSTASNRVRAWTRSNGWQDRPALPDARWSSTCVRLADGRLAIAGGLWTTRTYEDTSDGGELDYEYRSFASWIVRHHRHERVLLEHGDSWDSIVSPPFQGDHVLALPDGRVIADMEWIWTPPTW